MSDELKVIEEALNIANSKGCFNLTESYNIKHCLETVKQMPKTIEGLRAELAEKNEIPNESKIPLTKASAPTPPPLKNHK